MKKPAWQSQRGMVGLEIALLVLVLAVAGFVIYRAIIGRTTTPVSNVTTTKSASKIEQTQQTLSVSATDEGITSQKFEESTTTAVSSSEEGMGDSYDVNF
jgi:hypothetical protein